MKKIILSLALLILLKYLPVQAQYHEIKIGEQIPDLEFSNVFNFNSDKLKLSGYKGKLVILDFWGVYCAPCIEDFPKLDALQKQFKDSIQIITVSAITKAEMIKFFKSHPRVFRPSVPFLTGAGFLDKMFPHTGVPFQLWISPSGKVLQYANDFTFTQQNISKVLATGTATFRKAKRNVYVSIIDNRWKDLVDYSSVIMRYKYDNGLHIEAPAGSKRLAETGPIASLYERAFFGPGDHELEVYKPVRLLLDVRHPEDYVEDPNLKGEDRIGWQEQHVFDYQLAVPESFSGDLYQMMKDDLNRYFHLTCRVEKRKVKCYVLVRTSTADKLKTKGGVPQNNFLDMTDPRVTQVDPVRSLVNQPFKKFTDAVKTFVEHHLKVPFVDATGYTSNVDARMNGGIMDKMDLQLWRSALKEYDLDLVERECGVDMLVIRDAK